MNQPEVECYSGSSFAERPRTLTWQGRRLQIKEIHSRWTSPEGRGFDVSTTDGSIFRLFYFQEEDRWSAEIQAAGRPESDLKEK